MKTKLITFFIAVIYLLSNSGCSNKAKSFNEVAINEKIQTTFYGATFGDCQDSVVTKFFEHGLIKDILTSTSDFVHFSPKFGTKFISFGHMSWEMVDVGFKNNKFDFIRFLNSHEDKSSALEEYKSILNNVSTKYVMTDMETEGSEFAVAIGRDANDNYIQVTCSEYESISKKKCIGTEIVYSTHRFEDEVDEEL